MDYGGALLNQSMMNRLESGIIRPFGQSNPFQQSVTNATTPAVTTPATTYATNPATTVQPSTAGTGLMNTQLSSATSSAAQSAGNQYAQYGQFASGLQSLIASLNASWGK